MEGFIFGMLRLLVRFLDIRLTTHNSSIRSDEGLKLETSASLTFNQLL